MGKDKDKKKQPKAVKEVTPMAEVAVKDIFDEIEEEDEVNGARIKNKTLLSWSEGKILRRLARQGPSHGYVLALSESINLKTVYKSLKVLDRKGLVEKLGPEDEDGRIVYKATLAGELLGNTLASLKLCEPDAVVPALA